MSLQSFHETFGGPDIQDRDDWRLQSNLSCIGIGLFALSRLLAQIQSSGIVPLHFLLVSELGIFALAFSFALYTAQARHRESRDQVAWMFKTVYPWMFGFGMSVLYVIVLFIRLAICRGIYEACRARRRQQDRWNRHVS